MIFVSLQNKFILIFQAFDKKKSDIVSSIFTNCKQILLFLCPKTFYYFDIPHMFNKNFYCFFKNAFLIIYFVDTLKFYYLTIGTVFKIYMYGEATILHVFTRFDFILLLYNIAAKEKKRILQYFLAILIDYVFK